MLNLKPEALITPYIESISGVRVVNATDVQDVFGFAITDRYDASDSPGMLGTAKGYFPEKLADFIRRDAQPP